MSRGVVRLGPDVAYRRADNPGPMTLDGTNSYLVGRGSVLLVDPGPSSPAAAMAEHRAALAAEGTIEAVLLTHRHLDHGESAASYGRPVRAADPAWRVGPHGLADGDLLECDGTTVEVIGAPGHTGDSVALLVHGRGGVVRLLTGDTVLGRGSTVIAAPDGDLGAYLETLRRLQQVVAAAGVAELLPGHGPVVNDPAGVLAGYLAHREERLDQVRRARESGAETVGEVVAIVYAEVDRALWPAAEQSVQAQLDFLDRSSAC